MELALAPSAITPETKAFLNNIYNNSDNAALSAEAGYALGASLNKVQDPSLVTELQQNYQAATDNNSKVYMLQVMGNDQNMDFRPQIAAAAGSSDPSIRAAGIDALRFANDTAGQNLLNQATRDDNPGVRATAFRDLQYQPYNPQAFGSLSNCASGESDVSVRSVCVDVLCSHLNDPQTVSLLQNRASSETNPGLKMKIQEAITPPQASGH